MATKIPKQLFITIKRPSRSIPDRLGFLHAYEPGKAVFEKKKKTQLDWAYGRDWYSLYEDRDGVIWTNNSIIANGYYTKDRELIQVPDDLQPIIIDNDPRSGFKILRSVSRYSTSNKLWRVLDPIGIEFEITTGCFEDIVMNSTLINGEIQGKCVWISNKNLKVVEE